MQFHFRKSKQSSWCAMASYFSVRKSSLEVFLLWFLPRATLRYPSNSIPWCNHGATFIEDGISRELGLHPVSSSDYMIVHANVERLGVCHQAHPQLSNFPLNNAENKWRGYERWVKDRHAFARAACCWTVTLYQTTLSIDYWGKLASADLNNQCPVWNVN